VARPRALSILDPTSAVGRDLVESIATQLPELRFRFFHTTGEEEHLVVETAGRAAIVPPLVQLDELDGSVAVLVTAAPPPALATALLEWLRNARGVTLLDATQPGLAPEECHTLGGSVAQPLPARRWFHLLDHGLVGVARVLGALIELEPQVATTTVFIPAANRGEAAVEELAAQATARLTGHEPRRPKALPAVLAFDLSPAGGDLTETLRGQLDSLFPSIKHRVFAVDVGVFHGNLAALAIRFSRTPRLEQVRTLLGRVPHLHLVRRNQRVSISECVGGAGVWCTDIVTSGDELSVWVGCDGLRAGGVAAVVDLITVLTAS
jgi:hypothetical protein